MDILRTATAPLRAPSTYRRWVYLVVGGALFVPLLLAALVLATLPGQAVQGLEAVEGMRGVLAVVAAGALGGAMAWLPGVRGYQDQLARSLLGGPLTRQPPSRSDHWRTRVRAAVWLVLHLVGGFLASVVTMTVLTESALLAMWPFVDRPATRFAGAAWATEAAGRGRWLGPLAGLALLLVLVFAVALAGGAVARVAPVLLGPSAEDRVEAARRRADDMTNRARLAAELHDSIGHALSVVALQAAAAARVMDHDPGFARAALDAIADQARTATGELDHVLGLIREESPASGPRRTLADLPALIDAAHTTDRHIELHQTGPLETVPPVLSGEAYRLCQESLTNALRHGREGEPVTFEVAVDGDRLRLQVTNTATGRRRRAGGRGLASMQERVRLLGGEFQAGTDGEAWRLRVAIPLRVAR